MTGWAKKHGKSSHVNEAILSKDRLAVSAELSRVQKLDYTV